MVFVGLDDTDTLETPGTNKLAMHLAELLSDQYETRLIVRHQLLEDPRVPCTNKNGCASMWLAPCGGHDRLALAGRVRDVMIPWCPAGSDPGLCVADDVSAEVTHFGQRAQRELLCQSDAAQLAAGTGIYLEPLGGSGDGIIGALAAVGLLASWNSGRVVYCGRWGRDAFELTGCQDAQEIYARGVDDIVSLENAERIGTGNVLIPKRLRPNLRQGRIVLYVSQVADQGPAIWEAQRVVA